MSVINMAYHTPVLTQQVLGGLQVKPGGSYIDCTVGEGGHSIAILEAISPGGQLLGLDLDPLALETAEERLRSFRDVTTLTNENFSDLRIVARDQGFYSVDGILFDVGLSSLQLDAESRGFSFRRPDPLDMRFSLDQRLTAADIVNTYSQSELADVIFQLGEERAARRIASAIVHHRPISTSSELAGIVAGASGRSRSKIHPATKTFQALRIALNDELGALDDGLEAAIGSLRAGGRVVVAQGCGNTREVSLAILRQK